jgi:hypothetical protein
MLRQTEEASIKTRGGRVNERIKKGPKAGSLSVVRRFNTPFGVLVSRFSGPVPAAVS